MKNKKLNINIKQEKLRHFTKAHIKNVIKIKMKIERLKIKAI